jgi:hypothetical protein
MVLTNDFIINILNKNIENKKTKASYITRLETLTNKLNKSIYDIIKDPDIYYIKIKQLYISETSRKNMLTMILVIFKYIEELKIKKAKAKKKWVELHDELNKEQLEKYKKNEPSEKQLNNYVSFKEIEDKYKELSINPHIDKKTSFEYLLLSITLNLRPKRADFGNVKILYSNKIPIKKNYIVLNSDDSYFYLNDYKTQKTYKQIKEKITPELYKDIKESLKHYPREYLFTDKSNKPYINNNSYTKYVMRAYEHMFNRSVGVTMLRHIYIKEKLDFNIMSQEELEKEATMMGHSAELQRLYRWIK